MDLLQITLIVVLVLLAINLIVVGVYLFLVLKDFRQTVHKANAVLDNVQTVTDAVSSPAATIAGIISGVTQSVGAIKGISNLMDNSKKKEK
jgi:uncharacterized protein YoxC